VGFKRGGLDWEVVRRRCVAERFHGHLLDPVCRHPEGMALLYLGTYEPESSWHGPLNTLGNLRVELGAGWHLLAGSPGDYFHGDGELWLGFLRRQVSRIEDLPAMPESLRRFPRLGLRITQGEIAGERADPLLPAIRQELMSELPDPMRADSAADWSRWPGRGWF
jgi:hypothetical protein